MPKGDSARLRHILDAAKEAVSFVDGKSRDDLNINRMLVLSLVKEIEIIGEAAKALYCCILSLTIAISNTNAKHERNNNLFVIVPLKRFRI